MSAVITMVGVTRPAPTVSAATSARVGMDGSLTLTSMLVMVSLANSHTATRFDGKHKYCKSGNFRVKIFCLKFGAKKIYPILGGLQNLTHTQLF